MVPFRDRMRGGESERRRIEHSLEEGPQKVPSIFDPKVIKSLSKIMLAK